MPAFDQTQYAEIAAIVAEAITHAGTEAGRNLTQSQEAIRAATVALDERTQESARRQSEMESVMTQFASEKEAMVQMTQQKHAEMEEVKKVIEV